MAAARWTTRRPKKSTAKRLRTKTRKSAKKHPRSKAVDVREALAGNPQGFFYLHAV
jgi:hypothetical protein